MVKNTDRVERRVYGYFDNKTRRLLYIGSSYCKLNTLEYNHRNCYKKYPGQVQVGKFRPGLQNEIKDGTFVTLVSKVCDLFEIEALEGELIRALRPPYNKDLDPYGSSLSRGRYKVEA
jgi:hypothetical protein